MTIALCARRTWRGRLARRRLALLAAISGAALVLLLVCVPLWLPARAPLRGPVPGDGGTSVYDKDRNVPEANRFRGAEVPVTMERFLRCAAARLEVASGPRVIPLVVLAVSLEVEDLMQWMCNMTTTFGYLHIAMNGDADEMRTLLQALEAAVPSPRLRVEYHPSFLGYGAAVNRGYAWGLRLPAEEVPFIGVFNLDVRFSPGYVERYLSHVYAQVRQDFSTLISLEAMVVAESRQAAAAANATVRTAPIAGLSYAPLLPDRLRYDVSGAMRSAAFARCGPALYLFKQREMSAFFISRLGLGTIGFFDENYYPAYFEDYDYMWRAEALGHTVYAPTPASGTRYDSRSAVSIYSNSPYGTYVHLRNSVLLAATRVRELRGRSPAYGDVGAHLQRMLRYAPPETTYAREKCGWDERRRALVRDSPMATVMLSPTPFAHLRLNSTIPPDVWILDRARLERIFPQHAAGELRGGGEGAAPTARRHRLQCVTAEPPVATGRAVRRCGGDSALLRSDYLFLYGLVLCCKP
ncbi:galactofuranosyltransferase [Strigomonas culicis]|uniref:Galactofuranosyltransferase n=1 Tax=Strigomonas culicis TaxID=28005 RepID=S9TN25_9TRYP|nr:galactofuranosyltransferase [Strigomonas culicis]|eukprot:EPY17788.1 galactofuranosyltransferase [Strigomonas culicis]